MTSVCLRLLLFIISIISLCIALPSVPTTSDLILERRGDPRDVWILCDTNPGTGYVFTDGTTGFQVHSSIWVSGNTVDGPLKVETAINFDVTPMYPEYGLHLRILERPPSDSGKTPPLKGGRQQFKVGTIDMSNKAFFDIDKMEGFVVDEFFEDNVYRTGPKFAGNNNGCNAYARRLLKGLGATLSDDAQKLLDSATRWSSENPKAPVLNVEVKAVAYLYTDAEGNQAQKILRTDTACASTSKHRRAASCNPKFTDEGEKPITTSETELAVDDYYKGLGGDVLNIDAPDDWVKPKPGAPASAETTATMARTGNVLKTLTALSKADVLAIGGGLATIAGAIFVVLEFVDHDWVGGAIGAVGLAAGIAAGFLVTGPLGWVIGGAIALLFAILPGLFKDQHPPAKTSDVQGILQWKIFGDATHTGNEQCQKGTSDVPGNEACQALYGPAGLAFSLGMTNFDAVALHIQYNNGFPMTIKDLAAAFYVIDPNVQGDGDNKIATINCNNKKCIEAGRAGCIGGDNPSLCNHPTFAINRKLITLPNLGATADAIFGRIIPAPGGDCKIIAYPGTQNYPTYMTSIIGGQSDIACGLTAAINVNGVAIPVQGDTNGQQPQTVSSGSNSTSGNNGAFVAPPPATPFAALDPKDYACISYTGQSICLPPGTYQKQSGLGYEIKNTDTLTLPAGGYSLGVLWEDAPVYRSPRPQGWTSHVYSSNQSPPKGGAFYAFAADMQAIDTNRDGKATFNITGPNTGPNPICCLFTDVSLGGDAICLGVGGGPLPSQWQNQAQSATCYNGGQAWIYGKEYGDAGGAKISGNVMDLKNEPYGEGTFSKVIKALWISKSA